MAVPATMVYFVSFENLKNLMADNYKERTGSAEYPMWVPLLAGGLARTWAVTLVSPLELVRTKMQSVQISYYGMFRSYFYLVVRKLLCIHL